MAKKATYRRRRFDSGQHRRILAVAAVFGLLAFVPVAVRLCDLMVAQNALYSGLALRNQSRTTPVTANRGRIYDRNMNVLAYSESVQVLYLDPMELKHSRADLDAISQFLAQLLELKASWVRQQAGDLSMRYKRIASNLDDTTSDAVRSYINENKISGIHLEPGSHRVYPMGTLAAQVLGFTNASNTGSEGLEAAYNSFLEGSAGSVITSASPNSNPFFVPPMVKAWQQAA